MKTTYGKLALALGLFATVLFGSAAGTFLSDRYSQSGCESELPVVLNADSASAGKSMSMATGLIDRDRAVEGLFVLDHLSGNLQCWVINPRNGEIAAIYAANVNEDLGVGKGGDIDYVMTTGTINLDVRQNNAVAAGCVCYVGDGNSGKVVGYSMLYNRQALLKNEMQTGELKVLARGLARESNLRRDN